MPTWLSDLVIKILSALGSWLVAKAMEKVHEKKEQVETEKDIDQRLQVLKDAYKEAFNGEPITPDQRARLNEAMARFIRGGAPRGGM